MLFTCPVSGRVIDLPPWLSLSLVVYSLPIGISPAGWINYWLFSLLTTALPRKCYSYYSSLLAAALASQSIYFSMCRGIGCLSSADIPRLLTSLH